MRGLNKLVILIVVYSLFCGQLMIVSAQDGSEEKPAAKPAPKNLKDKFWVGWGYDVTGLYADSKSVKEAIFNISVDDDGNPIVVAGDQTFEVEVMDNPGTRMDEFFGKSLSEYQNKFSNRLAIEGSYKLFSGHLKTSFDTDSQGSTSKEFATLMQVVTLRSYKLPFEVEPGMIRPQAQKAIDTADPKTLFKRFGTHYIWQADVGGRVDYNFTKNNSSSEKDFNLAVEAKAAVKGVVAEISVENETKFKNFQKKVEENGSYKIVSHGGNPRIGASLRQDRTAFGDWSESVEKTPTLASFDGQSLRPIWDLASSEERKAELEEAFAEYVKSGGIVDTAGLIDVRRTAQLLRTGENWYATNTQNDYGNNRIGIYRPDTAPDSGYYVVAHVADNNNDPRPGWVAGVDAILVKEMGEPGKLLAKPIGFKQIYNDGGTRAKEDWSIWEANCPVNFVSLGHFARYKHGAPNLNMPEDPEGGFPNIRCVHQSLVEPAAIPDKNSFFFTGQTQGGYFLLVYRITPNGGSSAINANAIYAFSPRDYNDPLPANLKLWVLKDPSAASDNESEEEPDDDPEEEDPDDPLIQSSVLRLGQKRSSSLLRR